jgi:hypothetical protein
MKYEVYPFVYQSSDAREFVFKSIGPKGEIEIVVQFEKTLDENIIHLSFGNKLLDGGLDDYVRNSNNDRDIILATVASAVYEYTKTYPDKIVVFSGSTEARTRLYRMAITINLDELNNSFDVYGLKLIGLQVCLEEFKKGKSYIGFGVKRKKI